MVDHQQGRRRRDRVGRWLAALGGLAALVVCGVLLLGRGSSTEAVERITCAQAGQQFTAFHAGQLDQRARAAMEQHFRDCPHCRQRFEAEFLRDAGDRPLPGQVVAGLVW
jgi:hypothetical protein